MERNYPNLYPHNRELENEHSYYEWYENAGINSKIKTELQSGLYHLSVNIAFVSAIGIIFGLIILAQRNDWFFLLYNLGLIIFSVLSAISIVKRRLSRQWLRNYWEFEQKVILPHLNRTNQ